VSTLVSRFRAGTRFKIFTDKTVFYCNIIHVLKLCNFFMPVLLIFFHFDNFSFLKRFCVFAALNL